MRLVRARIAALLLLILTAGSRLEASCGSSSCPIDLHALLGAESEHFSLDLSFQYIDQDQPRIGSRKAAVGEIPSDHNEIRTINRLASLQLNYAVNDRFQLALTAPYVSRFHEHFDTESRENEKWSFGGLGDATVQARLRVFSSHSLEHAALWLTGGVKLPTGSRRETDAGGEDAEVTITPGTGSTDALLGLTYQSGFLRDTSLAGPLGHSTIIPVFVGANFRMNGRGTHDYRRGHELQLNAGVEYPLSRAVHLMGQVNARMLGKDSVGETDENPDLTGGRFVFLSPGVRVLIRGGTSAYAIVQVPAYQHVNGLQLTAKANYLVGVHQSF
jgi:hypothetical protein